MAAENVELARAGFDALASGGVEAMLEFVHPEFEMETPSGLAAEPQTYRGHDGLRRWFDSFYEVMDEIRVEPTDFEDLGGGRVLLEFTLHARGQASGIETRQRAVAVASVRDGLMTRMEFYPGRASAAAT